MDKNTACVENGNGKTVKEIKQHGQNKDSVEPYWAFATARMTTMQVIIDLFKCDLCYCNKTASN